jgi:hypothetical protein
MSGSSCAIRGTAKMLNNANPKMIVNAEAIVLVDMFMDMAVFPVWDTLEFERNFRFQRYLRARTYVRQAVLSSSDSLNSENVRKHFSTNKSMKKINCEHVRSSSSMTISEANCWSRKCDEPNALTHCFGLP